MSVDFINCPMKPQCPCSAINSTEVSQDGPLRSRPLLRHSRRDGH